VCLWKQVCVNDHKEHGRAQDGADLTDLAEAVCAANQVWRQVKHLDSTTSQLVDGLAAIQKVFQLLDRLSASRDAPSELVSWKDVANANPRAERKPV
jgi:U3 small nucleolar RNA-associated protein 14